MKRETPSEPATQKTRDLIEYSYAEIRHGQYLVAKKRVQQDLLEKILQPSPPLLEKFWAELLHNTLRGQDWHRCLKVGKRLDEPSPEIVEFRISLSDVHI
jgi:hypothetical protein